jgi:hypothetical protein
MYSEKFSSQQREYHHRFSGESHKGTVLPYRDFDVDTDCQLLMSATSKKGAGYNTITDILCHRSFYQRLEIRDRYKSLFGKDLIDEMKSNLSGKFFEVVFALLMHPVEYNAYSLNKAMQGLGTTEKTLTEIICTRSNAEIRQVKDVYYRDYKRQLEDDVSGETSGFYRRVLVACLQGNRTELSRNDIDRINLEGIDVVINRTLAVEEAQKLINAGTKQWGTDESVFLRIFLSTNPCQLKATLDEYYKLSGKTIFTTIDEEMSGDFAESLKALVLSQVNQAIYYARVLHDAVSGFFVKDQTLIRVIVTRAEIDLEAIKLEYEKSYNHSLRSSIEKNTSGDCRHALLEILQ